MRAAALLGFLSAVAALPSPSPQVNGGTPASDACAVVSKASAEQKAANPELNPRVSAAAAIACLRSVPNKAEPAVKLIDSVKAFTQWESTLTYLKAPPAGYELPPTDIMAGFDAIKANATAGSFPSEYDFQVAIVKLISTAHDGHFAFRPDIFKAFSFRNNLVRDVVSLSTDGVQVPKLYNLGVLNGTATTVGNVTLTPDANGFPPAITKINGQESAAFLTGLGREFVNTQDLDSQWNTMFQSYSSPNALPVVGASIIHQGDSLTLEYENGQTVTEESFAIIRPTADFTGVNTGEDFYAKFCTPAAAAPQEGSETSASPPATEQPLPSPSPNLPGFPVPAIRDSGADATAGYFLTGAGYEDTAVLSVLGFAPLTNVDTVEYIVNLQQMVGDFLAMCKTAGKKKLIVDVSNNGGGLVIAGYELYSQIFPGIPLFQANNLRRTEALVQMAEVADANLGKLIDLQNQKIDNNASQETLALLTIARSVIMSNLLPGTVFSAGSKTNLTTTQEILGPVTIQGDTFTAYQATDNSQPASDFNLTGVGSRANPPPAVFAQENVVILSDGFCGSTCTLFSYLMIMQNNVKTIALGGRPQTGPMQSMGGVEGAQVFELESINQAAVAAFILATPEQQAQFSTSDLGLLAEGFALDRAATPGAAGAVNAKNAFSQADAQTPLQFLNQPANCKVFYTKDMIYNPEATWKRAADAAFNDPDKFCVEGSQQPLQGVQQPSPQFFAAAPVAAGTGTSPTGLVITTSGATNMMASSLSAACAVAFGSVALFTHIGGIQGVA